KGQASAIYTYVGVFLVAVFALFLFVTQSGNQAKNLRTMVTTDASLNSQLRLRALFTRSYPVANGENMKIMTAVSYGCLYGKKSNGYAFTISESDDVIIAPERFLQSYFNRTVGSNYRLEIDCGNAADRSIVVGEEVPSDPSLVVSSEVSLPLAKSNRTEALLIRW
ncbi:MAG: hypothetical protein ABEJ87_01535, partial [Candidatus Nanohalobium sp.]